MSNLDESGVTYIEVSIPFEDLSDIGSPRADDHEHLELPGMLEDPYIEAQSMLMIRLLLRISRMLRMLRPLLSPEYVLESNLEAHPKEDDDKDPEDDHVDYLADGGDDSDNEEGSSEDDEDDDMDIEADEEEEHPAHADSVVVALLATDQAPSIEETEPFETDESTTTPPPHLAYRMTARISILAPVPVPAWSDSEVVRLFAMSSPPSSPLSPLSSPPPQIPFPPLPLILSPPLPVLSPAPPPSPIRSLGYRADMIRLRAEAASTSHSPPLPPPLVLLPTKSNTPSSRIPPPLPISAPASSPPLQLPSASRREDRPEVTLPPRKRIGITLGPGYEVGESLSTAARPVGGLRADYGFVATIDREIKRDPERELLAGRLNMLFRERRAHAYTRHLMETEARLSREAWVRSVDASDLARGKVMSLRTTVLGQTTEIRELHTADHRRQIVTSKMLRADHRRSAKIKGLRTADRTQHQQLIQTLTAQVTAQQGQQGPAGGPTQPELPEEAEENDTKTNYQHVMLSEVQMALIAIILERVLEGQNELLVNVLTLTFSSVNHYTSKALRELPVFPNGLKEWSLFSISVTELALLYGRMFPEEFDKIEKYIGGLPDMIHGSVVASKPKIMQEAVAIATELMD
nr:hypothetical protein [Tanacetum cinerariifolium]